MRLIVQRALVEQIAARVRRVMALQRLKRELLIAFAEDEAEHVAFGALTREIDLDVGARKLAADGEIQSDELGVAAEFGSLMGEYDSIARRVLRVHVRQVR